MPEGIDPNRFYTPDEVAAMTPEQRAQLRLISKAEASALRSTEMTRTNLNRICRRATDKRRSRRKAASRARKQNRA